MEGKGITMDHKELLLSESAKNQLDMVKEYKLDHDYSGALKIYLSFVCWVNFGEDITCEMLPVDECITSN